MTERREPSRKENAHDDYLAAIDVMRQRQRQLGPQARRGDEYARGYLAALQEFSQAVLASMARRIGS